MCWCCVPTIISVWNILLLSTFGVHFASHNYELVLTSNFILVFPKDCNIETKFHTIVIPVMILVSSVIKLAQKSTSTNTILSSKLHTDLLTYSLTYSMEQCPSWDANWFAASCEYFITKICCCGEQLLAPRPMPKLEDHTLSAVCDCLFNIFTAMLHIGFRSSIRNLRMRHAVVTRTHLSHGLSNNSEINMMLWFCKHLLVTLYTRWE
jgi:hypothetical protein